MVNKHSQECPDCGAKNGYFKVDDTYRCRSCNYDGPVLSATQKEQENVVQAEE